MTTAYRDLITRMAKELDDYRQLLLDDRTVTHRLSNEARAALAHWGNPEPAPPADGEVAELVRTLTGIAHWRRRGRPGEGDPSPFDIRQADRLDRAAELLERLSPPQPVPVSERLPGDQLCWWLEPDEEDDEAYGSSWTLLRICGGTSSYTHWLPAQALPIPHQQENAND